MICGCTRLRYGVWAKPQSVLAMTRSRPTSSARRTIRCATSSGMLEDVRGVADEPGQQDAVLRQLDVAPHLPLVLVARVGLLERVAAHADPEDEVDDVAQLDVVGVRPVPAPPAHVVARALRRDALQRAVERLDAQLRPLAVLGHRRGRDHRVVHRRQEGVVDLQAQAGVDDRAVLLVERVGEGEDELLVAVVVLVDADRHRARRRDDRQEALRRRRRRPSPP